MDRNQLICANVGDSRILLSRAGKAERLTNDHKPSVPQESERITNNGGLVIFGRVLGQLAVSRAFGDFEFKDIYATSLHEDVSGPLITCEPEVQRHELVKDVDEFVLLSCDGLFEVFSDQEAVEFIRSHLKKMPGAEQDPFRVTKELVNEAIYVRRSGDNVSVILIALKSEV